MLPTLAHGQTVLLDPRAYRDRAPEPGDIVVATHPQRPELTIVKRVAAVGDDGVTLLGDNPEASTDSRSYGPVALSLLRGRVVCTWT